MKFKKQWKENNVMSELSANTRIHRVSHQLKNDVDEFLHISVFDYVSDDKNIRNNAESMRKHIHDIIVLEVKENLQENQIILSYVMKNADVHILNDLRTIIHASEYVKYVMEMLDKIEHKLNQIKNAYEAYNETTF